MSVRDRPAGPDVPPPAGGSARAAAVAIAAVLAVFFAPALLGGGDFVYRDTGRLHAPMKAWIGAELREGRFPQWNPYAGLGVPVVANAIDAVQHPFTLLALLLPGAAALRAWILLSFALAAAGAYRWARALERSRPAAAVAAVAFALSGPLVSSSDNVTYLTAYAALPWLFAAVHRATRVGGPAALALVGGASFLLVSAGDPQAWGIAAVLVVPYAAMAAPPGQALLAVRRGAAALAATGVAALPVVLPVLAWLPMTGRADGVGGRDLARWNLHPARLVELLVPEVFRGDPGDPIAPVFATYAGNDVTPIPWFLSVYLGASVLALAALGALRERRPRVLAAAALLFTWAALGPHGGFGQLAASLPGLGAFRYWEKLAAWTALLVALAAAHGADVLLRSGGRAVARGTAALAGLLAGAALLAWGAPELLRAVVGGDADPARTLAANVATGAARAAAVLALLAGLAWAHARGRVGRAAPLALGAVVALDLFGGNAGAYVLGPPARTGLPPLAAALAPGARVVTPFASREDRWPQLGRLGSTWEWNRRTLGPSWNVPLRLGSYHDYVGLRERRWARTREEIGDGERTARLGLFAFSHLVVPGDPRLAARAGIAGAPAVAGADPELPAYVVELPHRPRAYLADAVESASPAEALAWAAAGGDGARTMIEGPAPAPAAGASPRGDARVVQDVPGHTVVAVRTDRPALVVLNDAWAPGWRAAVDGRDVPIVRANGLVRAVWVEAGAHELAFRYRTPGLAAGWAAAGAGLLALAAWGAARRARGTRAGEERAG